MTPKSAQATIPTGNINVAMRVLTRQGRVERSRAGSSEATACGHSPQPRE